MIYGIIIFVLTLTIDLVTDYNLWLRYRDANRPKGSVNHVFGGFLRLAALAASIYFLGWKAAPMVLFLYWILFDGIFNLLTGQKWFRLGTTAWLDKMQRKYPVITYLKYIGLIASTVLYVIK